MSQIKRYKPVEFFTSHEEYQNRVLLILNAPIPNMQVLERLWRTCPFKVCADGGANRLHDFLKERGQQDVAKYIPTYIHGDLDSLRQDVRDFYERAGVLITKDPDQYSTDFGKNLKLVQKLLEHDVLERATETIDVLVLGGIAGRLDHGLGLLHEMGREHDASPAVKLWLVSECSVSFLLGANETSVVEVASKEGVLARSVGIIPLYGEAVISTKGLRWDVKDWVTKMGVIVSTSNEVAADECEVSTNEKVLFTIERSTD